VNELHLFAGAGGGILGGMLLGHTTVCAVEIEKYPRQVLLQRQRDGILPRFPIWDDVCTFDGRPWRGSIDILCGGFPCQDISAAGKGAGIAGERSGVWKEYARIIGEIRPRFVFAENSPLLRTRGLAVVLEDLAALGYDARWCVLGARDVGAPHKRDRMWVLAYTKELQRNGGNNNVGVGAQSKEVSKLGDDCGQAQLANAHDSGFKKQRIAFSNAPENKAIKCRSFWHTDPAEMGDSEMLYAQGCADRSGQGEFKRASKRKAQNEEDWTIKPLVGRVANGVANRVHRLKAIGNGQVPQCAAMAFRILSQGLICEK
jgi:DNA (cytosine-5)-methyltransferase 1